MKLRVLHPRLCDNYNILFGICCACKIGQVSIAYDIYTQNTFNQEENRIFFVLLFKFSSVKSAHNLR